VEADIYHPPAEGERRGALLVVIGAAPEARKHPQAVRLAKAVARMGYVVMILMPPHLNGDVLHPGDKEAVVASFLYLSSLPYVEPQQVGIVGFSIGQGIAFAAATDPRIRNQVHSLVSFGGYYEVRELIASVTTGTFWEEGKLEPWKVAPRAQQVLRRSLLYYVPDAGEREELAIALETGRPPPVDMSSTGRLVYRVLASKDFWEVRSLLDEVPSYLAAVLDSLSPRLYLGQIRAPVFIAADRQDPFIPYTQSRTLRKHLGGLGHRTTYAEISIFRHVTPALQVNPVSLLRDVMRLWAHTYGFFENLR